jgi:hypothetical protein
MVKRTPIKNMANGEEYLIAQVGFLASRIGVNQEGMKAMLDACLEKMAATAGELQSVAVHLKSLKKMPRWRRLEV